MASGFMPLEPYVSKFERARCKSPQEKSQRQVTPTVVLLAHDRTFHCPTERYARGDGDAPRRTVAQDGRADFRRTTRRAIRPSF